MSDELSNVSIEPQLPLETPEAPVSLRDTIEQARDTVKEKQLEPEKVLAEKPLKVAKPSKSERERDEAGKFAAKTGTAPKEAPVADLQAVAPAAIQVPEIAAPTAYTGALKDQFKNLPPDIQKALIAREQDVEKGFTKLDEDRNFGKQLKEIATPYLPIIRAEGGDIPKAFTNYLNCAYALRSGTPQSRGELLRKLAQEFNADLSQTTQQPQGVIDPRFQQLTQEMQGLKSTIEQQQAAKKQQEEMEIQRQIDAFKADPKNVHFEAVKAHMASLLQSELAKDMQDAYDQAVYANPQTRSTLLEQNSAQAEEKRLADIKAKAEAAKRAGSSVKGSPGVAALKNGKINHASLRDELRANFAAAQES